MARGEKRYNSLRARLALTKTVGTMPCEEECSVGMLLSTSEPFTGRARCHACGCHWSYDGSKWAMTIPPEIKNLPMVAGYEGSVAMENPNAVDPPCEVEP